jgi:hypothetical protein
MIVSYEIAIFKAKIAKFHIYLAIILLIDILIDI